MSARTLYVVATAIIVGFLATLAVNQKWSPFVRPSQTITVAAAKNDLLNFEVVTLDLIQPTVISKSAFREDQHFVWPQPDGLSREQFDEALQDLADRACDRTVVFAISQGELLLDCHLAANDSGEGLAALVPKGMRAVSIDLSESSIPAAGYFVRPRDRVDILATSSTGCGPSIPAPDSMRKFFRL